MLERFQDEQGRANGDRSHKAIVGRFGLPVIKLGMMLSRTKTVGGVIGQVNTCVGMCAPPFSGWHAYNDCLLFVMDMLAVTTGAVGFVP